MPRGRTLEREVLTNLARTAHVPTMAPNGHSTSGGMMDAAALEPLAMTTFVEAIQKAAIGRPPAARSFVLFEDLHGHLQRLRKYRCTASRAGCGPSCCVAAAADAMQRRSHMVTAEEEESKASRRARSCCRHLDADSRAGRCARAPSTRRRCVCGIDPMARCD